MMSAQQARARAAIRRASSFNAAGGPSESVMPFDHAASFELKGIPGNIVQDVINISNEATFVAVAIGYGLEEDRARPAPLLTVPDPFIPKDIKLLDVPATALIEGFRLDPRLERLVFQDLPASTRGRSVPARERTFSNEVLSDNQKNSIVQRMKPTEEISFLFSIVDSGTGRELQDEPIHNLASLGKSNGERPFRMLAQPLTFQPRSTIRLQIVERSESIQGTLFIVLYGYKVLTGCTEPGNGPFAGQVSQSDRIIPFDYVSSFQLTGSPRNQIDDEVPINVEGGFVATSIGYGLAVESLDVAVSRVTSDTVNLGDLTFGQFPTSALQDGIRVRPNFHRLAFANGGGLSTVPRNVVDRLFERLNRPEDVSFRYSIFDTGSGRELQNQPINNIAGLGIANGDRPFKRLARPMLFQPRSTIRLTVEEQSGRGTLFIVFQGYKLLGGSTVSQAETAARRTRRR